MRKTIGFPDMLSVAWLITPAPFFWMPPFWITALMIPRNVAAGRVKKAGTLGHSGHYVLDSAVSRSQVRGEVNGQPDLGRREHSHHEADDPVAPHRSLTVEEA